MENLIRMQEIASNMKPVDYENGQLNISWTQFTSWKQCPHKWRLQYIDKHKTPPNIHFAFGTALHDTIQEYKRLLFEENEEKSNKFNLHNHFQEGFLKLYQIDIDKGFNHSSKEELIEFINDGLDIIDYYLAHKDKYFNPKYKLLGIELPIIHTPHPDYPNIFNYAKLDLVWYDMENQKIIIDDIKTSTRGWNKYKKMDKFTTNQLPLYKKYFSDVYDFPIKNIDIRYVIVKRKINDKAEFPAMRSRIQKFTPPSGKTTLSHLEWDVREMIEDCFEEIDGKAQRIDKEYTKNPGKKNCQWCPFKDKPDLCDAKGKTT